MFPALTRAGAVVALALHSLTATAAFDITIDYSGDTQYQSYFTSAEAYWESVITGYQPGISLGGLTIHASIAAIDGAWSILGYAGPTYITGMGGYVLATEGEMTFDVDDMAYMTSSGSFGEVIRHEMGHVLGIGTLWTYNGVYVDGSGQYTGAYGVAAYRSEFNQPGATFVPVELGGGAGTADGHWDEGDGGSATGITDSQGRDMSSELMTGWLNTPAFVSQTTLASLQDIGFTVNLGSVSAVPEPGSALMLALGLPLLACGARRRRAAA